MHMDLDDLLRIKSAWLDEDLKVPDLLKQSGLVRWDEHWTADPVIIGLSIIWSNFLL